MKLLNDAKVNARTTANLAEIERLTGVTLTVVKGQKISPGDASAGTHDGYGVVDLRTSGWSTETRQKVLMAARRTGNAAWYRTVAQGFDGPHIHAILMGDPDLSPSARRQVTAYRNGHNGLVNNGPDDGPQGYTRVTWESYLKAHPPEDEMTAEQMQEIKNFIEARTQAYANANNVYTRQILSSTAKAIMNANAADEAATRAMLTELDKEVDAITVKVAPAK